MIDLNLLSKAFMPLGCMGQSNIYVISNIYALTTNIHATTAVKSINSKCKNAILIYDHFESDFIPKRFELSNGMKDLGVDQYFATYKFTELGKIFTLLVNILITNEKYFLYIDSISTILQMIFYFICKFKNHEINSINFIFPYYFKFLDL